MKVKVCEGREKERMRFKVDHLMRRVGLEQGFGQGMSQREEMNDVAIFVYSCGMDPKG